MGTEKGAIMAGAQCKRGQREGMEKGAVLGGSPEERFGSYSGCSGEPGRVPWLNLHSVISLWLLCMENVASGQGTKESKGTSYEAPAVIQWRAGSGWLGPDRKHECGEQ